MTSEDAESLSSASQNTDMHLREPEDGCPSDTSPEPGSLSSPSNQQTQGSAVSALQSKVKALSERSRVAWKEPGSKNQDKRVIPGTFMLGYALTDAWGSSSSDEEGEPHKPLMFLTGDPKPQVEPDHDPISSEALLAVPRGLGEGASLENLSNDVCGTQEDGSPCDKPWMPPKYFWRSIRPELPVSNGVGKDRSNGGPWTVGSKMGHKFQRELQRSDSLESHLRRYSNGEVGQSGLWRADSLESMCSSGSTLSLAERVEMNRGLLKQMLQKTQNKEHVPGQRLEDMTHIGGRGKETCLSDRVQFFWSGCINFFKNMLKMQFRHTDMTLTNLFYDGFFISELK